MILIAAIVIGALAAYAVVTYVGGIEDRANDNARRVPVVRVAELIPRGTRGQEAIDGDLLERAEIAEEFNPPTAISPDELDVIARKAAVSDLAPGQVLVEDMFVDPVNSQITAARRLSPGNVAVTISVDDVRGVAGLIVPGDFINLMVVTESSGLCGGGDLPEDAQAADPAVTDSGLQITTILCRQARYLFQEVQVLFVDDDPVQLPGETATQTAEEAAEEQVANTGLITVQVPPLAAQFIASVPQDGFYLTLLPEDYTPGALPPLDPLLGLLPGEDPAQLTPCGPNGCDFENTP